MTPYQMREAEKRRMQSKTPPACTCDRKAGEHRPDGSYTGPKDSAETSVPSAGHRLRNVQRLRVKWRTPKGRVG